MYTLGSELLAVIAAHTRPSGPAVTSTAPRPSTSGAMPYEQPWSREIRRPPSVVAMIVPTGVTRYTGS